MKEDDASNFEIGQTFEGEDLKEVLGPKLIAAFERMKAMGAGKEVAVLAVDTEGKTVTLMLKK